MRKILSIIIVAIMLFAMLPASSLAASINISSDATELEGAGKVTVHVKVTNDSSVPMDNISISGNGSDLSVSESLYPSETADYVLSNVEISEDQLGTPIPFLIAWEENGTSKSQTVNLNIDKKNATAEPALELQVTRSADKSSAQYGETVTLTYAVMNPGTEEVTGVTLKDEKISASPIFKNIKIAAGATHEQQYSYTMKDVDVVSAPVVNYNTADGTKTVKCADSITISRMLVQIDVDVKQGETTSEGTDFVLTVTNNSNKPVENLLIKDELGKTLADAVTLTVGSNKVYNYHVDATATRNIEFAISCKLETGEEYSFKKGTYTVYQHIDDSLVNLALNAEIIDPLNSDGYVNIKFTVKNTGSVKMTDIELSEQTAGKVSKFKDLDKNEEDTVTYSVYAGEARDMVFVIKANDTSGKSNEFTTIVTSEKITGAGAATNSGNAVDEIDQVGSTISDALVTALIILGIITGLAGIALIVLAVLEHKENKKLKEKRRAQIANKKKKENDSDIVK